MLRTHSSRLFAFCAAFALSMSMPLTADADPASDNLSEVTPTGQPANLAGTWVIEANPGAAAKGTTLHVWTYGMVVSFDGKGEHNQSFQVEQVGYDERQHVQAGLYTIQATGTDKYLVVKDGKVQVSTEAGQWHLWRNSNGLYSITWYEDATKGANALSFIKSGSSFKTYQGHAHYLTEMARNNAGGKGNAHQLWKLTEQPAK